LPNIIANLSDLKATFGTSWEWCFLVDDGYVFGHFLWQFK